MLLKSLKKFIFSPWIRIRIWFRIRISMYADPNHKSLVKRTVVWPHLGVAKTMFVGDVIGDTSLTARLASCP